MSKIIKCCKCGGSMIEGFAMTLPTGRLAVNYWVEGIIERTKWKGIIVKNKRRHPISTFCCDKCARLESFADVSIKDERNTNGRFNSLNLNKG